MMNLKKAMKSNRRMRALTGLNIIKFKKLVAKFGEYIEIVFLEKKKLIYI